jgi:serine protease Do
MHVKVTLATLNENEQASNDHSSNKAPNGHAQGPTQTSVGLTLVPNSGGPGVLIQDIDPNSVAASKGFAVGDTILEVDNKAVSSGQDFEDAINGVKSSGRNTALIKAERDGQVRFIGLPLDNSGK